MIKTVQLFFISLLFTIFYLLFAIPVFAQDPNPEVPKNLHTYTQNVMIEVMAAMTCQLTGIDPVDPSQKCLGVDQKTNSISFVESGGGAIGLMGNLIAATYTPPFHTGDYVKYLAQNFGIAKPAYAQGVGFTGLNPLLNIWSAFRDIVYLLFVVVFVVIGLAIMLRLHIDPRTVMTIENQIPKIIIGLVMVTFSFAIAGFLIDMMYVSIYATHGVIAGVVKETNPTKLDEFNKNFNPAAMQGVSPFGAVEGLGGAAKLTGDAAGGIKGVVISMTGISEKGPNLTPIELSGEYPYIRLVPPNLKSFAGFDFFNIFINAISIVAGLIGGSLVGSAISIPGISALAAGAAGTAVHDLAQGFLRGGIVAIIAFLVIFIAVLWALFRLWFQLIIAYIYILIDVVFAPFWILAGLFPGSSIGFGAWLRDIVANLSAFPVTIGMFMLGKVFMEAFKGTPTSGQFVPPLIGNPGETGLIGSLIGIGIILMTPQVVTMMRDLLKAPNLKYTAAIGQAVGVGAGAGKGIATTTSIGVFGASKPGDKGLGAVMRRFVGI